ncbi:cytochrome P450 [Chytridium lagenaria]|nr:cytochrome P450 [Chytridium lagenaria]
MNIVNTAVTVALGGTAIAAFLYFYKRSRHDDRRIIPGPKGHWLVGVMADLIKYSQENHIDEWFELMHERHGDVVYAWSPVAEFLLVSDVKEIVKLSADVVNAPRGRAFLDVAEGIFDSALVVLPSADHRWRPHRRILSQGFTPLHLRYGFKVSLKVIDRLLDHYVTHSQPFSAELRDAFTCVTLDVIGHMLFSSDFGMCLKEAGDDGKSVIGDFRVMTDMVLKRSGIPRWLWSAAGVGLEKSDLYRKKLYALIDTFVDARRIAMAEKQARDERRDLLDLMLEAVDAGTVTEDEMRSELMGILFAGHETTAHALTAAVYLLSTHPLETQTLLTEIDDLIGSNGTPSFDDLRDFKFLDAVLKETLRLHPSTINLPRVSGRDIVVGGYKIPKGVYVYLDQRFLMKDERYWGTDAKMFRPGRWLEEGFVPVEGTYMPFGAGQTLCLGMKLANLEAKVVLIRLFQRFSIKFKEGFKPTRSFFVTGGFDSMDVELTKRE